MNWASQSGQDEWAYSLVGDGGYFVDIGAHDGIIHSNTYALEMYHGWSGICIEPDPDAYRQLAENRSGPRTDLAVSGTAGVITIQPTGVERFARPLTWILGEMNAPRVIDYLSVDVEGHELDVLAGMDFNRWHVKLATIEHNEYLEGPARKLAIRDHMLRNGFELAVEDVVAPGYGCYEDWFVNDRMKSR